MTFVHQRLEGDGEIVARLLSMQGGGPEGAAGVSVRVSLEQGAPMASLVRSMSGRLYFESRSIMGGSVLRRTFQPLGATVWLKLERRGSVVTSLQSIDGSQWATLGSVTISSAGTASDATSYTATSSTATAFVGMVAGGQDPGEIFGAILSDFRVTRLATLPPGWSASDVGITGSAGATEYRDGAFTAVNGSGSIADTADRFRYIHTRVSGNVELVARVVAGVGTGGAEAGVMVRESLAGAAAHVTLAVSKTGTEVLKRRVGVGLPGVEVSRGARAIPLWLKLVRRGTAVTTFESVDGVSWTLVASDALELPSSFFVGLSVAAGSGSVGRAVFDRVTVRAIAANRPPTVSILEPGEGARITAGGPLVISAAASDPDDRVVTVDFFVDGRRIGTDTATPYRATWASAGTGTHVLTAVAVDSDGARATSAPVTIVAAEPATSTSTGSTTEPVPLPPSTSTTTTSPPPPAVSPSSYSLVFSPSADHNTTVDRYVLRVFELRTRLLVVAMDLGRPAVAGAECTVDVTRPFLALPAGSYEAEVTAVDDATHLSSTGAKVAFTR